MRTVVFGMGRVGRATYTRLHADGKTDVLGIDKDDSTERPARCGNGMSASHGSGCGDRRPPVSGGQDARSQVGLVRGRPC